MINGIRCYNTDRLPAIDIDTVIVIGMGDEPGSGGFGSGFAHFDLIEHCGVTPSAYGCLKSGA